MGSVVEVIVTGIDHVASEALLFAKDRIEEIELLWSRFLPNSEISRLNRSEGRPVGVSPETRRLIETMQRGVLATRGAFDPTLIVPLVQLGYRDSLDGSGATTHLSTHLDHRGDVRAVQFIDGSASDFARLPLGTALDPGGIGKGMAADIVAEEIVTNFGRGALVSIGGDIAVDGPGPEGRGWRVTIMDPTRTAPLGEIRLARGGVATSSSQLRFFRNKQTSVARHHIIDPSTLDSTANGVRGVSVIAGTAAWAEILTKAAMVRGRPEVEHFDTLSIPTMIVDHHGFHRNSAWSDFDEARWN